MPSDIYSQLSDMFPDSILVSGFVSADEKGERTYSAGVSLDCQVTGKSQVVMNLEGQPQKSTVQIIVAGAFDIHPYSLIQLPARYNFRWVVPMGIDRQPDENGAHHETVFVE